MRLNAQQIAGDLADSLVDGYQFLLGATRLSSWPPPAMHGVLASVAPGEAS